MTILRLKKMTTVFANPVQYSLTLENQPLLLNALLGQTIRLRYMQEIYCIQCQRKIAKSFQQGYCFPCYKRLLACNLCMIHPERCRYYEGACNPDDWAHAHCGQPHVVYLANSSGLKIGITRADRYYSRWIDQGATQGLLFFKVQNRFQAGTLETLFKKWVADKTNWQAMLKGNHPDLDLIAKRDELFQKEKDEIEIWQEKFNHEIQHLTDNAITLITYPVLAYPSKIKTFDLEKTPLVEGSLLGIKGQYLLLDTGVISIRKFGGYAVEWHHA